MPELEGLGVVLSSFKSSIFSPIGPHLVEHCYLRSRVKLAYDGSSLKNQGSSPKETREFIQGLPTCSDSRIVPDKLPALKVVNMRLENPLRQRRKFSRLNNRIQFCQPAHTRTRQAVINLTFFDGKHRLGRYRITTRIEMIDLKCVSNVD